VRRIAKIAASVILGLWALYALAANVVLRTGLLHGWLNGHEEKLKVDWRSAWTWCPGRIHVRGYAMRFQDSNVQFQLDIDRVTFQIDPFSLVGKKFHLSHVDAEGTRFLARHKLDGLDGNGPRAAAFAHIEGFSDPPLRTEPPREIPDSEYNLWTVELDDVSSSVREIWIEEYRYVGAGSVAGGFRLKPVRELEIHPSAFVMAGGVLSLGEKEIVRGTKGTIEANVPRYDVRVPKGVEVFGKFDARVDFDGDLVSLAPIGAVYIHSKDVEIDRGAGRIGVHMHARFGPFTPESFVKYETNDVNAKTPAGEIHGTASTKAHIVDAKLVGEAAIANAALAREGKDVVHVKDAAAHVDLGNSDITQPFRLAGLSFVVGSAAAPDLRPLQGLAPHGIVLHGGAAQASGRASFDGDTVHGNADATLERAHVTVNYVDVTTSGKLTASLERTHAKAHAALKNTTVKIKDAHADDIALDVDASGAVSPAKDVTIEIRGSPGDKLLRLVAGVASVPEAGADAVGGPDLRAQAHVRAKNDDLAVDIPYAKDGSFDAHGGVRKGKTAVRAAFVLDVGPLTFGVEKNSSGVHVTPAPKNDFLPDKLR
jgi:hypothetical protein